MIKENVSASMLTVNHEVSEFDKKSVINILKLQFPRGFMTEEHYPDEGEGPSIVEVSLPGRPPVYTVCANEWLAHAIDFEPEDSGKFRINLPGFSDAKTVYPERSIEVAFESGFIFSNIIYPNQQSETGMSLVSTDLCYQEIWPGDVRKDWPNPDYNILLVGLTPKSSDPRLSPVNVINYSTKPITDFRINH
jgi:hypothetical protein